ncbi:MAG: SusC/RagA family TonB-linked outer membrane protein [Pseudopedobacter saltans]|uniref:SusC/RagA family TonB-linked outer membrane protein n=1 Tax=Pseudopedobacter saltans TaxID=151895 RepID=A0A2W5EM31_9SPHI|nr:MAG: SusC/RagA family TonB-linked outer membrane protein [Pseudopedobacter saltans]
MSKTIFKRKIWVFVFILTTQITAITQVRGQLKAKGNFVTVVGTVTDSANAIIEGVSVSVENNNKLGTTTDVNGKFVLDVPVGSTLVFKGLTYNDYMFPVPETLDSTIVIVLSAKKVDAADEVIVAAYGRKQLKESNVGAVTTIKPSQLKIPASNLTNALAGQIAGIIAYQPGGQPGYDNSQFFIRGVTTFGYSSSPLILIDNIESTSQDLARLQVDDIESFSILKDAGSTSLYGSRGANGVLLITTKKGKEGRANLYGRFENAFSSPTKNIKLTDPITYMNNYNEALITRDPTASPLYDANKIINTERSIANAPGSNPYAFPAVDWLNMLFKSHTSNQRANLSVRGGGAVATYYVSGSYNVDNGILKVSPVNNFNNNVKLQNYQFRSNVDVNLTKTTILSLKINGVFDNYNGPITTDPSGATDLYSQIMHTPSVLFPAFFQPDSANTYTKHVLFGNYSLNGTNNVSFVNPYANLLKGYSQFTRSNINVQVDLSQQLDFITPGLKFSGIFSTQRNSYYSATRQYNPFYYQLNTYDPINNTYTLNWLNNVAGQATEYLNYSDGGKTVSSQTYMQGILSYDKTFGLSTVSATMVGSRQEILNSALNLYASDGVTPINTPLVASLPYRNVSSSGRLSYTYDRRYSIEGSFGYNGSERFSAKHRWGFFPTIGGAWNVSNEAFWGEGVKHILSRLKIRGTYGSVGNDALSSLRFFYLSSINLNTGSPASFGTENLYSRGGVNTIAYPNPDITWETSRQGNLGIDMTFLNSLNITIDLYKQHRFNIYQTRVVPQALGLEAAVAANLGSANTKGMDVQMDYSKPVVHLDNIYF